MGAVEDRTLDLDGRALAYLDGGPEGGPTILLVHGGGDNAATWHELFPDLTALGRVLAPDLAGHGRSDDPPADDDGPPALHLDLVRLLDALRITAKDGRPVVYVGHSLGSPVALSVAARRPPTAVLLLDGAPRKGMLDGAPPPPVDTDVDRARLRALGIGAVRTPDELDELLRTDPHPEQVRRAHQPGADGRLVRRPTIEESVRLGARGRRPDNPYLDVRLYAEVAVPTIALQGTSGNQAEIRDEVDALLGANPLVDVRWLDAGHSIHWDRPDAVVDAVRELLAAAVAAGRAGG